MSFDFEELLRYLNKKDLKFWAGATKTGSASALPACCMLAQSIFMHSKLRKVRSSAQIFNLSWNDTHRTEFLTEDFVILKVVKCWNKLQQFFICANYWDLHAL